MRASLARVACLFLLLSAPVRAQDQEELVRLELRVVASDPGSVVQVDRGSTDALEVGDVVTFFPREGGSLQGRVSLVEERNAEVKLSRPGVTLPAGTRGEVLIPKSRVVAKTGAAQVQPGPVPPAGEEHPPWKNEDETWEPGMPLLAQVQAVKPSERSTTVSGLVFFYGDVTFTDDSDRNDYILRLGEDIRVENPFGHGGGLNVAVEMDYRTANVPDDEDERFGRLRVDRLSYYEGGTRFDHERWELGRFLQYGIPEFGVVDGFEWGHDFGGGDRLGFSIGEMPQTDGSYDITRDTQIAAYYHWAANRSERLTADLGLQQTFHGSEADRDLMVAKLRWLPPEGWDLQGTAWVDFYGSNDDAKGAGVELTQAWLTSGRGFGNSARLEVIYNHLAWPELLRDEYAPAVLADVVDDHVDRLSVDGWLLLDPRTRLHGQVGGWIDEDETGGDAEAGADIDDLLSEDSHTDLTVFGTLGEFGSLAGARLTHGQRAGIARWDAYYEITSNDQYGFSSNYDDILQQRLGADVGYFPPSRWSFSFHTEAVLWDDDGAWSVSLYISRSL